MNTSFIKRALLVVIILFATEQCLFAQPRSASSQKKKKGLSVLVIGDSNTEIGNITTPFKAMLDSAYGNYGTGYCTLNPNSIGRIPEGLEISVDSNWKRFDMRNDFTPATPPYYSPDGLSISSAFPEACAIVHFSGNAFDLYYLQGPLAGSFSVTIDGIKRNVKQSISKPITKKISFNNLTMGKHIMLIKVISGKVTLLGVDAKNETFKKAGRYILHKYGNAWSSTQDYLNIDSTVFTSGVQQICPDKVVIILGTNDHNLDHRNASDFKSNLKELIVRIKKALPHVDVLVVSTFTTNSQESKTILPGYLSISFPEAARETHSEYWDMNAWLGPFDQQKMPDGTHVNEVYGQLIARELFNRLK